MKAKVLSQKPLRKLIGVIRVDGSLVLRTETPFIEDKGYPAHVISESVGLTTGSPEYWLNYQPNATPIYEGDKVEIQF